MANESTCIIFLNEIAAELQQQTRRQSLNFNC